MEYWKMEVSVCWVSCCQVTHCFWGNIRLWRTKEMDDVSLDGLGVMVGYYINLFVFRIRISLWNPCETVKQFDANVLYVFSDSSLLNTIDGAHLDCVIKNHPALVSMSHLLPENVLVSGNENIPGLSASPTGKLHITGKVYGQWMMLF